MRKNFLIYNTGIFLIFFNTIAYGSAQRYHCKFPGSDISAFDKMVEVYAVNSNKRTIFTDYFGERDPVNTHDEGNIIVTVYEDLNARKYNNSYSYRSYQTYLLFKIDMSSSPVIFYYGYAYHDTVEGFERAYQMPYTEKNFNAVNRNPEILKYIPPKEHEQHMSFGFWRTERYDCGEPLNYFEYKIRKAITLLMAILSA